MADPNVPQPIRIDPKVLKEQQNNPKVEESGFLPSKIQIGEGTESYDARIRQERKDWEVRHSREVGETEEHFQKRLVEQKKLDKKPNESQEDYDRRVGDILAQKQIDTLQAGIDSTRQGMTTGKTAGAPRVATHPSRLDAGQNVDLRYKRDVNGNYVNDNDGTYQRNADGSYSLA